MTRCGNLYGGGDLNFNRLVPGTIRSALRDESPVIRSDGTFVRDYFYVRDAVDAYLALAERVPDDGLHGEAFNFGTETPLSVIGDGAKILEVMDRAALPLTIHEPGHQRNSAAIPRLHESATAPHAGSPSGRWTSRSRETVAWYRDWLSRVAAAASCRRSVNGRAR